MATATKKSGTASKKKTTSKKIVAKSAVSKDAAFRTPAAASFTVPGRFEGFPKKGLQFLRDIKENQDRDWFRERKDIYEEFVRQPMEALVIEAAAASRKRGFPLYAKEKSPVTRIYRDIRFSSNKDPFHTHVGAGIKRSAGKAGFGEVYIHISPEVSFLAAGFWMPERPFVNAWRASLDRDPDKFLTVLASLRKHGLEMSNEKPLARLPRGYERHAGKPIEPHLKLISYTVSRTLKPAEYHSPKMLDQVVDFVFKVRPLLEYGWALNSEPTRDMFDERL
jgi:uncharacterized protein (TIGR02453 family)